MSFDAIVGQEGAVAFLRRLAAGGRVPSALLFLGPPQVGKRTAALALAQALNCLAAPGEGCGRCPSCRRIAEGVHPDVEMVTPEGRFIKIDQVRGVAERLALIPFEARRRVIIVAEAERMNLQAANAFLKTLEEPPADTLIVLTAAAADQLPETVVSRCLPVRFGPLPEGTIRAMLGGEGGLAGAELEFAVGYAQGRLRPELCRHAARLLAVREALLRLLEGVEGLPFDEVSAQIAKWSGSEEWPFVLECLEAWLHDVALLGQGGDARHLINRDRSEEILRWRARLPPARAVACYRRLLELRAGAELNINKALAMEALWLTVKRNALAAG